VVAVALQLIALYSPQTPAGPQITGLDNVVHTCIFAGPAPAALMAGITAPWALGILAMHGPISELVRHFARFHTAEVTCSTPGLTLWESGSARWPTWSGVVASPDKVGAYPMATAHNSVTDTAVENHRAMPDNDRYRRPAGRSHDHRA